MSEVFPDSDQGESLEVRCYFVRNRNALLVRTSFEALYVEYYLHLADRELRYAPEQDQLFKDALAAVTLHCASRPWNESTAWTINFQIPLLNLFVTGDNHLGTVVGQLFTEDVKENNQNLFYSKTVRGRDVIRTSAVAFEGGSVFRAVEHYYHQSEQRPARYIQMSEEDFVMVSAQPDCDMDWFQALKPEDVSQLPDAEELSLLEKRRYRWECGCDREKIHQLLAAPMRANPQALFEGEDFIKICCPRCGMKYIVTREAMEAYVLKHKK